MYSWSPLNNAWTTTEIRGGSSLPYGSPHMRINSDNKIKNKNLKEAGSQKSSKMKCSNNLSSVKVPFFLATRSLACATPSVLRDGT